MIEWWFLLVGLGSEVLGTVGGFGSSLFFVPLSRLFFDLQTVLAITGILHIFSNISKIGMFRKTVDYKLLFKIGIPAVLMVIAGAILGTYIDLVYADLVLGIFILVFSVVMFIKPSLKLKTTNFNVITGGGLSGFLAGLTGTGGAVRGIVLTAFSLEKNTFIATSAAIDLGVDSARSVVYLGNGYLRSEYFIYIPLLFVIAIVGSYLGKLILKKVSEQKFKKIVLIFIFLTGLLSIYNFSFS